jgi:multimeric flavodoxin WrbA
MQTAIISVVYHSRHGHTAQAAKQLAEFLQSPKTAVHLIRVEEASRNWQKLHASDTIIFGCPTLFGDISARFKVFMEETEIFWYKQPWKNKFAAAFTLSPTLGGDKQHTLLTLALFAAQHGMHWISLGVPPRFLSNQQTSGQNRLGSYVGLMIQADSSQDSVDAFQSGDLLTMELFARSIVNVTLGSKNTVNDNLESQRN